VKEGAGWKFPYSWIMNPSRILVWLILAIAMAYSLSKEGLLLLSTLNQFLVCCPLWLNILLKEMGSQDSQRLVHSRCRIVARKKDNFCTGCQHFVITQPLGPILGWLHLIHQRPFSLLVSLCLLSLHQCMKGRIQPVFWLPIYLPKHYIRN